ncbi:MAG: adenylate/guanylate cyclase domain-containing protein [Desulfurivibrionaceae bacterium]|jgi:adenylate cyclase
MNFRLRSKKQLLAIASGTFLAIVLALLTLVGTDGGWSSYDYRFLDSFYRQAVQRGHGPQPSFQPRIVYLAITDNSYNYFQKNILDRKDLARVNDALRGLNPEAVAYDVIFARPSNPDSDQQFTVSLKQLGRVYLPYGFAVSEKASRFRWESGVASERLRGDFLGSPTEKGTAHPSYAVHALMQYDDFARVALGAGNIGVDADPDSVYRHMTMLLKVDDQYFPTLSLAIFLDWLGTRFNEVEVEWGRRIIIPAHKNDPGEDARVIIPIDAYGRALIPFVETMGKDFPVMAAHTLLENFDKEEMRGNLAEFFEGAFVLVADTAIGAADLGDTPLERGVPLVTLHAAMLNGMLTSTFYGKWPLLQVFGVWVLISVLLGCAAMQRRSAFLYGGGFIVISGLFGLTWIEFIHFRLFPIATTGVFTLAVLAVGIATLQMLESRDRSFVRKTFSRYVPEKVVRELLNNPEAIKLGGEEKEATVLFSDIANFTTLSEKMPPAELVCLLNEYLTEMSDIILQAGGIIDKYEGDAIMAEFGIPLAQSGHADQAVRAAVEMQRRLKELREIWRKRGQPALYCRVGINTGNMLVGNMGSQRVMDYTVIGDAVNLASRLEEANKLYGTSVMISEATFAQLSPGLFRTRPLDVLKVKGKSKSVKVHDVYGGTDDRMDPQREAYYATYQQAFDAYLHRDFIGAKAGLLQALILCPADLAASRMSKRIEMIEFSSLPDDWDGAVPESVHL